MKQGRANGIFSAIVKTVNTVKNSFPLCICGKSKNGDLQLLYLLSDAVIQQGNGIFEEANFIRHGYVSLPLRRQLLIFPKAPS
jgi:hypothetical protein